MRPKIEVHPITLVIHRKIFVNLFFSRSGTARMKFTNELGTLKGKPKKCSCSVN